MRETTVAVTSLGCKANQYDGAYLTALLQGRQFRLVDFKDLADIYVVNTCTVTDHADLDSRNLIRRAHRRNPEATLIVTGCYAQTRPQEVAEIEGVRVVLGNAQKFNLLESLERAREDQTRVHIEVDEIFRQTELESFGMASYPHNSRAYVKIQDGCNQFCSFCMIPYARGRNRSVPIPRVLEELRKLREQGFAEAVLTGIHLGTYGQDREPRASLRELLEAIEIEKPIHRVRVSSVDPEELDDGIVEVLSRATTLCPHWHIPLQSGDDRILKMMRRRYEARDFRELCEKLVKRIPHICIGTDVIVGFPYEEEAHFQNTFDVIAESPVAYCHVFPYSPKRGTRAAQMLGQVAAKPKQERAERLRELSQTKARDYRERFLGEVCEVVVEGRLSTFEGEDAGEYFSGTTENYIPVWLKAENLRPRQIVRCRLEKEWEGKVLAGHG